jgi:hypothetical protein
MQVAYVKDFRASALNAINSSQSKAASTASDRWEIPRSDACVVKKALAAARPQQVATQSAARTYRCRSARAGAVTAGNAAHKVARVPSRYALDRTCGALIAKKTLGPSDDSTSVRLFVPG